MSCKFDWDLGGLESGWETLFNLSALDAASGKHVRVVTADLRNGYTTIPIQFDNPLNPSSVLLYFTNSRGQWKKEYVSLAKSSPSPPNAKDQLAMILNGVYKAVKVSRKTKTASFNLDVWCTTKKRPAYHLRDLLNMCVFSDTFQHPGAPQPQNTMY